MVSPASDDLNLLSFEEDLASEEKDFEESLMPIDKSTQDSNFWSTVGDVLVQTGKGYLKAFTWPADVFKLAMIGEGLSEIEELEEIFKKEGKPFDREKYIKDVFETAEFIPTQELAEKSFEDLTGISLEPKSEFGKRIRQASELAGFTRGGIAKKIATGAVGAATTETLKQAGIGEDAAEIIGDVTSIGPASLEKSAKKIPTSAQELQQKALKYSLPFKEFMVKERTPLLRGKLLNRSFENLKNEFNVTAQEAIDKVISNQIPAKRLREKGVNLDALSEFAYARTRQLAQNNQQAFKTDKIIKNINNEINRIKSLAPSPSEAQKQAINILEKERDVLKISNPTSEQLVNQHINYNSNVKGAYRKPEFSGSQQEVVNAYNFLNNQLVETMTEQGSKDVAEAFKAANKIHHEKSKLLQTENIINKAFKSGYNPKKLKNILNSRDGKFLKRNLGKDGIKDLEEIAEYGVKAEEKMSKFLDNNSPTILKEVKTWGQLAPILFFPNKLVGTLFSVAKPLSEHIQGQLLTRNATRDIYKLTLKHASEGSFNLLKKDFARLGREISKEWGSEEDFIDHMLMDLDFE